jgi:DNA end-binding protein Ku
MTQPTTTRSQAATTRSRATPARPAKASAGRKKTERAASEPAATRRRAAAQARDSTTAGRAIWKGTIALGRTRLPVKLYSAVEDRSVHFHLLHAKDKVPIRQQMVNPKTGEAVPSERIRKGFELEDGVFVLLDRGELASIEPEASRDIEVARFVEAGVIAPQYYDRPYWLGPDGDRDGYFALVEALRESGREGVLRWTMRKKRYAGALRSDGEYLSLIALRPAEEVLAATDVEAPPGRPLSAAERRMAQQLVAALEGPFDPSEFRDEFRHRVLELIERKQRGGKVKKLRPRAAAATSEGSLERALAASLRATAKERKTA